MKILFLGYEEYLSFILRDLKKTNFFIENKVDVIFAKPNFKNFPKKLLKLIKNKDYSKLHEAILIKLNRLLYKNKIKTVNQKLFFRENVIGLKEEKKIRVIEYDGLKNIKGLNDYDFMIVASFGTKIPSQIFRKPKHKTLNIHPSLLPKHRGGYPTYVQACNFEKEVSTTIHFMEEKWDNGDVVIQDSIDCNSNLTNYERYQKSAHLASLLLQRLSEGNFNLELAKQDKESISYCHKLTKVKKNINSFLKEDSLQGYVLSNYASHLFPFSYIRRGFLLMSILEVSPSKEVYKGKKDTCLFKKNDKMYLNHFGKIFFINKYIYKGNIITQEK
ncbi:MAG: hypothetical protein COB73_08900 [Flavobacteriaceae bacterium]|nr:MAG: hypothetical protein COB73_08900 [Flavobacteriaceae bacterium]